MIAPESSIHYLEIVTPDAESLRTFYEQCHGFEFRSKDPVLGNAYVATLPGGVMFGIRAPMHGSEKPVVRTYVRVKSLDASVQIAAREGAKILLDRMELPGHGIIAIFELGGTEHGLWEVQ